MSACTVCVRAHIPISVMLGAFPMPGGKFSEATIFSLFLNSLMFDVKNRAAWKQSQWITKQKWIRANGLVLMNHLWLCSLILTDQLCRSYWCVTNSIRILNLIKVIKQINYIKPKLAFVILESFLWKIMRHYWNCNWSILQVHLPYIMWW